MAYAEGLICSVSGCVKPRRKRTWCHAHYSKWIRHGDPLVQKRATSTEGVTPAFKKQWLEEYKLERGCADCGYKLHPAALDFDHLPGTIKHIDIRHGSSLGWVALQEEVAKCEVVCANCHRIRTSERRGRA